ncbi:SPOR domain-containing protein [Neobacillus bataviensis]|uniref:SPOR domain-containing protein n=1 Tax=Neobacillus bataviensis TaxID=220685 RepID=UPI001CBCCA3C|nr:SPOR domain-containing protein [Neobacillus bataviensis]
MDKPKKGNTITIKLNGENQSFQEQPPKQDIEAKIEANLEPYSKVIKIDRELPESEGMIETAAAQESVDESFDWIIPESAENEIEEFKFTNNTNPKTISHKNLPSFTTNFKKKNGRPLSSILISAFFAVLIGTTIGFFMLKLVITEQGDKVPTTQPVVSETGTEKTASEGKSTSSVIDQLTTYVVQGGVFSSKEGTQEIANDLEQKGVPSQTVELNGKFYLLLGLADSIETAKALGNQYKENGVEEVFAKPLLLDEKKVSNVTDKERSFMEELPSIYQTLAGATSNALVTKTIPAESAKSLAGIEEQLKASGIKNEKLKNLKMELTSADEKIKAYQKSKAAKSLTEAQQHLLNFVSQYNAM